MCCTILFLKCTVALEVRKRLIGCLIVTDIIGCRVLEHRNRQGVKEQVGVRHLAQECQQDCRHWGMCYVVCVRGYSSQILPMLWSLCGTVFVKVQIIPNQ